MLSALWRSSGTRLGRFFCDTWIAERGKLNVRLHQISANSQDIHQVIELTNGTTYPMKVDFTGEIPNTSGPLKFVKTEATDTDFEWSRIRSISGNKTLPILHQMLVSSSGAPAHEDVQVSKFKYENGNVWTVCSGLPISAGVNIT